MKSKGIFLLIIVILFLTSSSVFAETSTYNLHSVSGKTYGQLDSIIKSLTTSYKCYSKELSDLNGNNKITSDITITSTLSNKKKLNLLTINNVMIAVLVYNTPKDYVTSYEYGEFNSSGTFIGHSYNKLTNATLLEDIGFNKPRPISELLIQDYEIDKVIVLYGVNENTNASSQSPIVTKKSTLDNETYLPTVTKNSLSSTATTTDSSSKSSNNDTIILILIIAAAIVGFIILIVVLVIVYFLVNKNRH